VSLAFIWILLGVVGDARVIRPCDRDRTRTNRFQKKKENVRFEPVVSAAGKLLFDYSEPDPTMHQAPSTAGFLLLHGF